MKKDVLLKLTKSFEEIVHVEEGVEYWMARDIQVLLEYGEWRNFCNVIEKAKIACQNSGRSLDDHFVEVNKMVLIGSEGSREITDMVLSRYACYLIAQNGDSRKEPVAFAQTYFAIQTRKQESFLKALFKFNQLNSAPSSRSCLLASLNGLRLSGSLSALRNHLQWASMRFRETVLAQCLRSKAAMWLLHFGIPGIPFVSRSFSYRSARLLHVDKAH